MCRLFCVSLHVFDSALCFGSEFYMTGMRCMFVLFYHQTCVLCANVHGGHCFVHALFAMLVIMLTICKHGGCVLLFAHPCVGTRTCEMHAL